MRQNRCEGQTKKDRKDKTFPKNLHPKTESRRPLPSPGSQILMNVEEGSNYLFHLMVKFEILSGHLRDREDQYDINVIVLHMSYNTHFH